jgi:hypothetical protein
VPESQSLATPASDVWRRSSVNSLVDPRFHEAIANPQLISPEQVKERVAQYERLGAEINALRGAPTRPLNAQLKASADEAARLLARFLEFARGTPGRELIFAGDHLAVQVPVDLDQLSRQKVYQRIEEAHANMVAQWRAKMKLDLPPGFIFIKVYASREQMASDYKLGPETAGVAFPCRFIAVALSSQESRIWGRVKPYFVGEEFQQTVAHELVHCFCFMTLGYLRAGTLPRWFMEGFALQFSGERRVRTAVEGPGGLTIRDFDTTEEYREFKQLFQFVLEKYGADRLYDFARISLVEGSVERALPQALDLASEPALTGASVSWRREKERLQWKLILIVLVVGFVIFATFRGRWEGLRWVTSFCAVWIAMAYAAVTPYYIHTSLWWIPAALSLPLVYLIIGSVRRQIAFEPPVIRLVVVSDWPRLDELMEPWPYEQVDLGEIAQADTEYGWGWGERDLRGSDAWHIKDFLDTQPTDSFYFHGHAYRVWYEGLMPAEGMETEL